jgi:hypothetical protein
MPSFDHEILVELLRRAPDVVLALLGALAVPLPGEANATVVDRAFSEVSLSEIHADLVVLLREEDRPRLVVIVEVQRTVDVDKDYTWPLYAAAARREHRCDAAVLVITQDPGVVRRASEAIALGPGNTFRVFVVGPDEVPVPTREEAHRRPELAVLAALAHARSPDALELAERALFATEHLDEEHAGLYWDRILDALSESDRITLETRMSIGKIEYKSDFAKRYYGAGLIEGEARGSARRARRGARRSARRGPRRSARESGSAARCAAGSRGRPVRRQTASASSPAKTRRSSTCGSSGRSLATRRGGDLPRVLRLRRESWRLRRMGERG